PGTWRLGRRRRYVPVRPQRPARWAWAARVRVVAFPEAPEELAAVAAGSPGTAECGWQPCCDPRRRARQGAWARLPDARWPPPPIPQTVRGGTGARRNASRRAKH